jgi:CRP/FNR family transcriptional regulator
MSSTGAKVPSSALFTPGDSTAARGVDLGPCAACAARQLAFCNVLDGTDLGRLLQILTETTAEAGHAVFYEGDEPEHVYNVTEGVVRVSKMLPDGRRQITGFLFPGDFLGLSHGDVYAYTAEAITPARLCRFKREKLLALFDELPHLEKRLLGMAADELAAAQDQILLLGRKTARERVVSFFLLLAKQARKRGELGNPIELPMSRADIADYLGLTIETVSRTITKLSKDGVIELPSSNKVVLADMDTLEAIEVGDE